MAQHEIKGNRIPVGMRPGRRELGPAALTVAISQAVPAHMQSRTREIIDLIVPAEARRQKLGTMLLNLVCQEADANGITLILVAKPFGEPAAMDVDALRLWYQRFGFQVIQEDAGGPVMARQVHRKPNLILAGAVRRGLRA